MVHSLSKLYVGPKVPSPLVGEGQGEGACGMIRSRDTPHPSLSPQGGKEQNG